MSNKRTAKMSVDVTLHTDPRAPTPVRATRSQGAARDRAVQTDRTRGRILFHSILVLEVRR